MTFRDAEARDLDSAVNRGVRDIARTVARLERARMERDAATLAAALTRDLIAADDFAAATLPRSGRASPGDRQIGPWAVG